MGAEDTPVRVELIKHDEPQVFKEPLPVGVVGEDPQVEHVRV